MPIANLVLGNTLMADCTFVADRGGYRQTHRTLFSRLDRSPAESMAQTVTWRVMTPNGFSRPDLLNRLFDTSIGSEPENNRAATDLRGREASFRPLSHSGTATSKLAATAPRIRFAAATEEGPTR